MDTNHASHSVTPAPLRRFRTPVRGHAFAAPPPEVGHVDAGAPVALVREPANPADPLAVAVWAELDAWGPWRLGYLDRGVAARIAPRLDAGLELHAELEGWTPEPDGRWQRPLIALWPAPTRRIPPAPQQPSPATEQLTDQAPPAAEQAPLRSSSPSPGSRRGERSDAERVRRDARVERRLPGVRRRRVG